MLERTNPRKATEAATEYMLWLLKQGYRESTITSRVKLLKTMMKRCDVMNPESVKLMIAKSDWSEGRKENAVWVYLGFAKMKELAFNNLYLFHRLTKRVVGGGKVERHNRSHTGNGRTGVHSASPLPIYRV